MITQTGNTIDPGSIQHFADSVLNAIEMGQRQFFTPPEFAKALFTPLSLRHCAATACHDFMVGSGALLAASGRGTCYGIDVDARATSSTRKGWHIAHADVTRWYPLAAQAGLVADLLALNPPFSLRWDISRFAPLANSSAAGVTDAYRHARGAGKAIDSTPATLMLALDRLTHGGEGFMICNAATARRFFGSPDDTGHESAPAPFACLRRNIWAWLEVPGVLYENQGSPFDTAVLYFARSHGIANRDEKPPLWFRAPSADPDTVALTLAAAASARPLVRLGAGINAACYAQNEAIAKETWHAVASEYAQRYHGIKPAYNLRLDPATGRIRTYLDPFRKAIYRHDSALLHAFQNMDGESPASLVVQQVTRAALRHALTSECWRVDPALIAAVDAATAAYESARAPFYAPSPVQSLGWIDEASSIRCIQSGLPGISPGDVLPLRSWIESTNWDDVKINAEGKEESIRLSGRELVVEVTAPNNVAYQFHVKRDEKSTAPTAWDRSTVLPHKGEASTVHLAIEDFLRCFEIPTPKDIAQQYPERYQEYIARLEELERHINSVMARPNHGPTA